MFGIAKLKSRCVENEKQTEWLRLRLDSVITLNKAYINIIEKEQERSDEKIKEITNKLETVSAQYYETVKKILEFNKEVFIKEVFMSNIKDKEFESFRAGLLKPLLEAKWNKEKEEKGDNIINKGVQIIDERNRLYDEILTKERQGENVDKEKEQLKSFDWILETLNAE